MVRDIVEMLGTESWDINRANLIAPGMNLAQTTMKQVYDKYGLEETTRDFIGHSMALYPTDDYIEKKGMAKDCVERDRKSTRLNSSHSGEARMPSSA